VDAVKQLSPGRIVAITLIGFAIAGVFAFKVVEPPPPRAITMASGSPGGAYNKYAKEYQRLLARDGVTVTIVETSGSIENIDLLEKGEVDVGFVQTGVGNAENQPQLRSLASLYYEPLWLFYRGAERIDHLGDLKGKKLGVGAPSSGTRAVAVRLLDLNELTPENTTFVEAGFTDSVDALEKGELDAAFFITSPTADVISRLVKTDGIRLMNFRRYRAYSRNLWFISDTHIHEGMLDIPRNIPGADIVVLSTLATLASREDLHPGIVQLLLKAARDIHSHQGLLEGDDEFPSRRHLTYRLHDEADAYLSNGPSFLSRYVPFQVLHLIRRLAMVIIPLLTLLLPVLKVGPMLYKVTVRKRIYRWYGTLLKIEARAREEGADIEPLIEEVNKLDEDVQHLVDVPMSYRGEYFSLRAHILQAKTRLKDLKS
jgi:TRAP transporter TAXI family solute receptor